MPVSGLEMWQEFKYNGLVWIYESLSDAMYKGVFEMCENKCDNMCEFMGVEETEHPGILMWWDHETTTWHDDVIIVYSACVLQSENE